MVGLGFIFLVDDDWDGETILLEYELPPAVVEKNSGDGQKKLRRWSGRTSVVVRKNSDMYEIKEV
ncbi:hypothetical protein M5K25_007430 [Dendrobium thyrsiflorum]|uniref:Uncharacterized protein n=1 Tax=Dendrobium thyrsiflorum TaxID=117978 RepID=A0ABD0VL90_DENTH